MTPRTLEDLWLKNYVVKNHWGEVYHVMDENHFSVLNEAQPDFKTIDAARQWASEHNIILSGFKRDSFAEVEEQWPE